MWVEVTNFGLQYCGLSIMIKYISFMLRSLTINIDIRNKKRPTVCGAGVPPCGFIFNIIIYLIVSFSQGIPLIFYFTSVMLLACNIYIYVVSTLWFVLLRCRQLPDCDLVTAVVIFSLGIASNTGWVKLLFICFYQNKIRDLLAGYLTQDSKVENDSRFSGNLLKSLKGVKKRVVLFFTVVMSNAILYSLLPFIRPGRHLNEDSQIILGLEPMFESPNYEMSLFLVSVSVIFICYVSANGTALFIIMSGYIEAQMKALSVEIQNVWDDAHIDYQNTRTSENESEKQRKLNKFVEQRLVRIINNHTNNIKLQHQVEDVFRGAIGTEFVFLVAALLAELLGGLEKTYMAVPFTFMQAVIDCWTGQLLIDASVTFERAVYECKWENFNGSNMRIVMPMLQSAQKTMKLSAGGIATLSFACLMSVIRSVYSAYTTLRSSMD